MADSVDKQTFLAGAECLTRGWCVKHAEPETPSPSLEWRFHAGSEIARYAREWLGEGRMLRRTPEPEARQATANALADPESRLLFEASFRSGSLVARADALRRRENGWDLIEIKSGTTPADGRPVKSEYIDDVAYTTLVAKQAGLVVGRILLVLLNREYRVDGRAAMFEELDVTDLTLSRVSEFASISDKVAAAASAAEKPTPSLQYFCKDCPFFSTQCVGVGVPDPLFSIPRLSEKRFGELRAYGRISQLPATTALTEAQQVVAEVIRSGDPRIELGGLELLDRVVFPLFYLDFEAISPHIPWFPDRPPYDATPFQYSLHLRTKATAPLEHRSYLAPSEGDWRRDLITQLLGDLGSKGTIFVYSSYERTRLTALAVLFPDLEAAVAAVIARLFDLEEVVRHGYIHPDFGGRTSIKKVLPVLARDLTYDGLAIDNGDDAAGNFGMMRVGKIPPADHAQECEALLAYCQLDTLAMVRIHEELQRIREQLPRITSTSHQIKH